MHDLWEKISVLFYRVYIPPTFLLIGTLLYNRIPNINYTLFIEICITSFDT